jgi:hypothetical protein
MYTDFCIPKDNEEEFIKTAISLGTEALVFLYDGKFRHLETKFPHMQMSLSKIKNFRDNNRNAYVIFQGEKQGKSFHHPNAQFTQVTIKELASKDNIVLMPFWDLGSYEIFGLFLKLAEKHKLRISLCSFAKDPYQLRSKIHLKSFVRSVTGKDFRERFLFSESFL